MEWDPMQISFERFIILSAPMAGQGSCGRSVLVTAGQPKDGDEIFAAGSGMDLENLPEREEEGLAGRRGKYPSSGPGRN